MSQAIITKFISATNTRPSRIKATCWGGSITISYDYSGDESHRLAAQKLIEKLGWSEDLSAWQMGGMPDNSGFAFVRGE